MAAQMKMRGKYLHEHAPGVGAGEGGVAVGATYRNVKAQAGFASLEGVSTLFDLFERSVRLYPDSDCLGRRINGEGPFVFESYKTVAEKVKAVASAMAHVGVGAHGRAGIYSINCPEWMQVMQACNRMTIYTVPLYDTLGEDAVEYIVKKSESSIVFVSAANWPKLAKSLPALREQVHTVVYWGSAVDTAAAAAAGTRVFSFDEFLALGRAHPAEPVPPQPSDLCTIMFTSGTTGMPKGVMIPHTMVLVCVAGVNDLVSQLPSLEPISSKDSILSYLPLAHIMDRASEEQLLSFGARIGYFSGDVKKLVDDIGALKPTLFLGVPRVFDRIYSGVMDQVGKGGAVKKFLFNYGFQSKLKALNKGVPFDKAAPFFDKLVFSKIKARLGGRVRIVLSGAAPLAPHVEDFLRVTMCCYVGQGYGLTETCAATFISSGETNMAGSVGIVSPAAEFRLASIPEMKYDALAEPPRGEVCVRGPVVFSGYFKDEEMTKDVLEADGWFHTGDVGELLPSGGLKIIDRKKQIFKLSQGEYIAVERVEAAYKQLGLIAQIFVYGNSFESVLVAVVVPDEAAFPAAAAKEGLSGSLQQLAADPKARALLQKQMDATAKQAGLKGFEMVRGVILEHEPFGVENNLLTPTFKLKRPQLQEKYQAAIDRTYAELKK